MQNICYGLKYVLRWCCTTWYKRSIFRSNHVGEQVRQKRKNFFFYHGTFFSAKFFVCGNWSPIDNVCIMLYDETTLLNHILAYENGFAKRSGEFCCELQIWAISHRWHQSRINACLLAQIYALVCHAIHHTVCFGFVCGVVFQHLLWQCLFMTHDLDNFYTLFHANFQTQTVVHIICGYNPFEIQTSNEQTMCHAWKTKKSATRPKVEGRTR